MQHAASLRPRGLLEIVDHTFRLYRSNFWLFFGISAVVFIPFAVIQSLLLSPAAMAGPGYEEAYAALGYAAVVVILALLASLFSTGALTKAVSDRYLGEAASVGSSFGYVAQRLLPFVGTLLAAMLLVFAGLPLLIVGAIVFAFWVAFVSQVFIIEDKRYFAAVGRSRFLIGKGVWAQILVLGLITNILAALVQAVVSVVFELPMRIGGPVPSTPAALFAGLGDGLARSLTLPIGLVANVLLYYDSRIRKEGFDLEILARELGKAPPAPTPGPSLTS